MTTGSRVDPVGTPAELEAVCVLLKAYAASLPVDLSYQEFECEMTALPDKYAPPGGGLWLARDHVGQAVGCVALRTLEDGACEMKRLYLNPSARGSGVGRQLAETVIGHARSIGCSEIRLDTLPTMKAAAEMYRRIGFRQIEPYYSPTPDGTIFMALRL